MEMLPYNIQFFADGEGAEESEPAEQTTEGAEVNEQDELETDDSSSEETPEAAEPEVDENSKYAAARREAEAQVREANAEFARRFGHINNPNTGKPIQSIKDYLEALDAQEKEARDAELKEKGIDPNMIERAIANNPVVVQAQNLLQQEMQRRTNEAIQNDLAEIQKLNPDVTGIEKIENFDKIQNLVRENHIGLLDAYKIVNFDILAGKKASAAKQAAINQAKGKEHLKTTEGGDSGTVLEDIPSNKIPTWKEWFPDKTMKQLKELYNQSLHK